MYVCVCSFIQIYHLCMHLFCKGTILIRVNIINCATGVKKIINLSIALSVQHTLLDILEIC